MPKITQFKEKYMAEDIGSWVVGQMHKKGIKQSELADELGMTQPAISYRLMRNNLEYRHLLTIFRVLETPDEEILRLMKVR